MNNQELERYQEEMKSKFADMTEEEISAWDNACDDALEPTEEMKKHFIEIKKKITLKEQSETEWQNKNAERVKAFFLRDEDDCDWDRHSVIYNLSTMLFDSIDFRRRNGDRVLLDDIKETFPDLYVEALEGFLLGNHDT